MSIKEIYVTSPGSIVAERGAVIPVRLTYDLQDRRDLEILTQNNPDYIFLAFVIKDEQVRYVFGDARRHDELKQAIGHDIGEEELGKYIYGQLWFEDNAKAGTLTLSGSPGNNDEEDLRYLSGFFQHVNQDFLGLDVVVSWSLKNQYYYDNLSQTLSKVKNYNVGG